MGRYPTPSFFSNPQLIPLLNNPSPLITILCTSDRSYLLLGWFRSFPSWTHFPPVLYVSIPAFPDRTELPLVRHRGGKKSSQQLSPLIHFSPAYQKLRNLNITSANPALLTSSLPCPHQCLTRTLAKLSLPNPESFQFLSRKKADNNKENSKMPFFHPVTLLH